jgi:hypothetical protein
MRQMSKIILTLHYKIHEIQIHSVFERNFEHLNTFNDAFYFTFLFGVFLYWNSFCLAYIRSHNKSKQFLGLCIISVFNLKISDFLDLL